MIAFVLLDVALILGVARLVGGLFLRLGQPRVVGEIVAGILLGPTLLGLLVVARFRCSRPGPHRQPGRAQPIVGAAESRAAYCESGPSHMEYMPGLIHASWFEHSPVGPQKILAAARGRHSVRDVGYVLDEENDELLDSFHGWPLRPGG